MAHPQELRAKVAEGIRQQINQGIESGDIVGVEPLPDPSQSAAPPAAPEGAPAPTPPTGSESQEPAKPEEQPSEQVFGKYKDMTEAEKGYWNMVTQSKVIADENTRLREQLTQAALSQPQVQPVQATTVPGSLPGADPRVNPVGRDYERERAVKELSESLSIEPHLAERLMPATPAIDPNAMQETLRQIVREEVAPVQAQVQQAQAGAVIQQRHPDMVNFQPEIELFIQTADPVTQQTVKDLMGSGNYTGAMDYAILAYRQANAAQNQTQIQNQVEVDEAARTGARAAAAMPASSPGTPVHAADPDAVGPDPKYIQQLAEAARGGDRDAHTEYLRQTFLRLPGVKEKLEQAQRGMSVMS
jgi:hypothetical protein